MFGNYLRLHSAPLRVLPRAVEVEGKQCPVDAVRCAAIQRMGVLIDKTRDAKLHGYRDAMLYWNVLRLNPIFSYYGDHISWLTVMRLRRLVGALYRLDLSHH